MVTETWLSDDIPDEALYIPGFTIVRNDRSTGRGGGVAIYIRETLPFKIRCEFNKSEYECLWIILRPKWLQRLISKLALACVYLPPSLNTEVVEGFYEYVTAFDTLISESPNASIIASGDFNPTSNGFKERVIINHCQLKQVVKKPTKGTAILDLILSNAHPFYVKPKVLGPIGCSDHCVIEWKSKEQLHDKNKT